MAPPTPTPRPARSLAIIGLVLVALYGWIAITGNHKPKLGIDLAGGTSLTMKPQLAPGETGAITDDAVNQAVNVIRQRVDGLGVAEATVTKQGSGASSVIVVEVPGASRKDLYAAVGTTAKLSFRKVLQSGAGVPVTPSPSPSASASGTVKPSTTPTPTPSAAVSTSPTASSNGRPAAGLPKAASPSPSATTSPSASASPSASPGAGAGSGTPSPVDLAQFAALDCSKLIATHPADIPDKNIVTCDSSSGEKFILGPQVIPGSDISSASAGLQTGNNGVSTGAWVVNLNFNGAGTAKFADVTRQLYAQPQGTDANRFAIVLDGLVESAPSTNAVIPNGQAEISGNFTQESATALANVLSYGALPLAFAQQQTSAISPELGSDALYAGVLAGLLGLALVVIYLLLYYRGLGLVAVASLLLAALLTYGSLCLLGATIGYTLTLAGIAGAIVSIGITADSFVVLFERVRDEMREGRTFRVAVEAGWRRARRTILAADAVSFIAAVTLYLLAVGNVQGFAFTLGLTTIIDVVVVFLFTKPLMTLLARRPFFGEGHRLSGVDPERVGRRRRTTTPEPAVVRGASVAAEPREA